MPMRNSGLGFHITGAAVLVGENNIPRYRQYVSWFSSPDTLLRAFHPSNKLLSKDKE